MRSFFVMVFCFFLSWQNFHGQEDSLSPATPKIVQFDTKGDINPLLLDETRIEQYQNDPHFDYTEKVEETNLWQRFKNWLFTLWVKFWTWLFGDYKSNSFLVFLFKALPYLIIGGLVIFIIWVFYRLNPGAKIFQSPDQGEVFFTADEEIIKSKNIEALIDGALQNKDYRLAVRYYFLLTLKKLHEAELIEYEFDKTNTDYASEIKQEPLISLFKRVAHIYEFIWYGNFRVSEPDFFKAQSIFVNLSVNIPAKRE